MRRHVVERRPRVDEDDALFVVQPKLRAQLQARRAVLGNVHQVQPRGRQREHDPLVRLAIAALEQRRLATRLGRADTRRAPSACAEAPTTG